MDVLNTVVVILLLKVTSLLHGLKVTAMLKVQCQTHGISSRSCQVSTRYTMREPFLGLEAGWLKTHICCFLIHFRWNFGLANTLWENVQLCPNLFYPDSRGIYSFLKCGKLSTSRTLRGNSSTRHGPTRLFIAPSEWILNRLWSHCATRFKLNPRNLRAIGMKLAGLVVRHIFTICYEAGDTLKCVIVYYTELYQGRSRSTCTSRDSVLHESCF